MAPEEAGDPRAPEVGNSAEIIVEKTADDTAARVMTATDITTLDSLEAQSCARIQSVGGEGALRQHFLDMGVIPGAIISFVKSAPMGDPLEFRIHGYELTLRRDDAAKIEIELLPESAQETHPERDAEPVDLGELMEHPGLGEGGRFHNKSDEHPLPESTMLTFALAGNQNCG